MPLLPAKMECTDDFPLRLGPAIKPPAAPPLITPEQEFERCSHDLLGVWFGVDGSAIGGDKTAVKTLWATPDGLPPSEGARTLFAELSGAVEKQAAHRQWLLGDFGAPVSYYEGLTALEVEHEKRIDKMEAQYKANLAGSKRLTSLMKSKTELRYPAAPGGHDYDAPYAEQYKTIRAKPAIEEKNAPVPRIKVDPEPLSAAYAKYADAYQGQLARYPTTTPEDTLLRELKQIWKSPKAEPAQPAAIEDGIYDNRVTGWRNEVRNGIAVQLATKAFLESKGNWARKPWGHYPDLPR